MSELVSSGTTLQAKITDKYWIAFKWTPGFDTIIRNTDTLEHIWHKKLVEDHSNLDPGYFMVDGNKYDIDQIYTNETDGYKIYKCTYKTKSYKIVKSGYRVTRGDFSFTHEGSKYIVANVNISHNLTVSDGSFDFINAMYTLNTSTDTDLHNVSDYSLIAVPVEYAIDSDTGEPLRTDEKTNVATHATSTTSMWKKIENYFTAKWNTTKTGAKSAWAVTKNQFSSDNLYDVFVNGEEACKIEDIDFDQALENMDKNDSPGTVIGTANDPDSYIQIDESGVNIIAKNSSVQMNNDGTIELEGEPSVTSITEERQASIPLPAKNLPLNDILPKNNIFMVQPSRMPNVKKVLREVSTWAKIAKVVVAISGSVVQTVGQINDRNQLISELEEELAEQEAAEAASSEEQS